MELNKNWFIATDGLIREQKAEYGLKQCDGIFLDTDGIWKKATTPTDAQALVAFVNNTSEYNSFANIDVSLNGICPAEYNYGTLGGVSNFIFGERVQTGAKYYWDGTTTNTTGGTLVGIGWTDGKDRFGIMMASLI